MNSNSLASISYVLEYNLMSAFVVFTVLGIRTPSCSLAHAKGVSLLATEPQTQRSSYMTQGAAGLETLQKGGCHLMARCGHKRHLPREKLPWGSLHSFLLVKTSLVGRGSPSWPPTFWLFQRFWALLQGDWAGLRELRCMWPLCDSCSTAAMQTTPDSSRVSQKST